MAANDPTAKTKPIASKTPIQTFSVRSLRLKKRGTMMSPMSPYVPRMSPCHSRTACTRPNASSHQWRVRSSRRASSTGSPFATCRECSCQMP